ncbi:MAG: phosphoribosylamine--glycine ligase [Gemmatimonadales bacterium]
MRILVVGGGGREHALSWALHRDLPHATLFAAPGNPGTALLGTNLPIDVARPDAVPEAARAHNIDLVVIGPEAPLAAGLADGLRAGGHRVFGPSRASARIESSKAFAKDVMAKAGVPTAGSRAFTELDPALRYVAAHPEPLVVKASGLAAGKGVLVCPTRDDARAALRAMLAEGRFGDAGREVLVEEFLEGEELSVLALTDGERMVVLPAAQDHKRIGEGDTGPNTGGMGAYCPVSLWTPALLERVRREVLRPTLRELAARGAPYAGVLYAGLMIAPDGTPYVLEFNCRFGDPEAQAVLPVLPGGLAGHLMGIADGSWRPSEDAIPAARCAVTTVLAAPGYPDRPEVGAAIDLPADPGPDVLVFHAGTYRDPDGELRVHGGRVLSVTGLGTSIPEAATRSRAAGERVRFQGKQVRSDIGWREIRRAGAA